MIFHGFTEAEFRGQAAFYSQFYVNRDVSPAPQPSVPDGNYDIGLGLFGLDITRYRVSMFYRNTGIFL